MKKQKIALVLGLLIAGCSRGQSEQTAGVAQSLVAPMIYANGQIATGWSPYNNMVTYAINSTAVLYNGERTYSATFRPGEWIAFNSSTPMSGYDAVEFYANARTNSKPPSLRMEALLLSLIHIFPYAITSLLLRKALWDSNPPSLGVVLIQKEVAERCMGCFKKDGDRSLLSLMIGLSCSSAHIIRKVPPQCFYPPPKVDSALFAFVPMSIEDRQKRWGIDAERVMKVAKVGFAHPRKQLASNLVALHTHTKQEIESLLASIPLNPKIRAEELSVEHWVALAKLVGGSW